MYDQVPNGGTFPAGAKLLSTASKVPFAIKAGAANALNVTLSGVPAALAVSGLPSATAGQGFGTKLPTFTVTAKDTDGYVIVGPYDKAITLSDSDATGATTIATTGSDAPPARELLSSDDVATIDYTGLAIVPATVQASAVGAAAGSAQFAPILQPMNYSGPEVNGSLLINLYPDANDSWADGLSANVYVYEAGWTTYNQKLTATPSNSCSAFSTTTTSPGGTAFTVSTIAAPVSGSCTLTISDGVGQKLVVPISYDALSTTVTTSGSTQYFTVPVGVARVTITAAGAQGGAGYNGPAGAKGGSVTGTFKVTPGETLDITIGGAGGDGTGSTSGAGGSNGGGGGGGGANAQGGGGGGRTTVRDSNGTEFIIGGAGGGSGAGASGGAGGAAGDTAGQNGTAGDGGNGGGGGGGAMVYHAGLAGIGLDQNGVAGSVDTGGAGGISTALYAPGGGGAGAYGGGGGGTGIATGDNYGGGGGGGSSYAVDEGYDTSYTTGTQSGNGIVIIAY